MVKSHYTFEKRHKEIGKKKKKEEKRLKKLAAAAGNNQTGQAQSDNDPADIDGRVWSGAKEFLYSHIEAVTSIWDSISLTETN